MAECQQQSSETVVKRQRRPSVRLGEIGDQPAAILSETGLMKRKKGDYLLGFPSQIDGSPISFAFQSPLPPPLKLDKMISLSASPDHNSPSFSGEGHAHDMLLPSPISSHSPLLGEQMQARPNSSEDIHGQKISSGLNLSNNWGRNGKRKRGGMQKLRRVFPSVIQIEDNGSEKAFGDAEYSPSDEPNDDDLLESDCQAFKVVRDPKESGKTGQDDIADGGIFSDGICELSRQVHVRDNCSPNQEDNTVEDKEGSAHLHARPMTDTSGELFGTVQDENVRCIPNQAKASEAKGWLESTEHKSENENKQVTQQQPEVGYSAPLMKGVNDWLCDLGLGKYIPLFEVHEVDIEVLPFLTMDDLKDMGISAVGTRRKMFCAIQCIRKRK